MVLSDANVNDPQGDDAGRLLYLRQRIG